MDFALLPLEIKFHIFSFISQRDLQTKVATVSSDWNNFARDPRLQHDLHIQNSFSHNILRDLRSHNKIRNLKMTTVENWDFVTAMPRLNYLRNLEFHSCKFESPDVISQIIEHFPKLQCVKLEYWMNNSNACITKLPRCDSIKTVLIGYHPRRTEFCRCLNIFVENCRSIENVEVFSGNLPNDSFLKLVNTRGRNLKNLHVNAPKLSGSSLLSLRNCCQLVNLSILRPTNTKLTVIKTLSQLQNLTISCCSDQFFALFNGAMLPQLTFLNLEDCWYLQNNTLELLANSCPGLQTLSLENCNNILDSGLDFIIDDCKKLEELRLTRLSQITGTFLKCIHLRLPSLKYLALFRTRVNNRILLKVKEQNPALRITDYKGHVM